ncbi:MAG TPA: nucleoside-diphosphate sugar epimerase/dehydratase [Byssovorax sp.]|jgi:FlaA1/EpsC-like NDP-sugar epimerase
MNRFASRTSQGLLDVTTLLAALGVAFALRFDWNVPPVELQRFAFIAPYVVAVQYVALVAFSVTRFAWRYIGLREVTRFALAIGASSGVLVALRVVSPLLQAHFTPARHGVVPLGVIAIDAMLAFAGTVTLRATRRLLAERAGRVVASRALPLTAPERTLLVGAGNAGVAVAREIEARQLGIDPVGFVDDDALKGGTMIQGLPVLGPTTLLGDIAAAVGATQVLITIANAKGSDVRRIVGLCDAAELPVKIIPGLHEIVGGRVNLSRVRDVAIEDLLRREPVRLDDGAILDVIRGRVALVTGAGGSIGSELCRQICGYEPKRLLLVERAENALFEVHRELLERWPRVEVVPLIADIGDAARMEALFVRHAPEVIFHAAAHKHVPMMECNAGEAVKNNVLGTKRLADLADRRGVRDFVLISTDKAVNPTSVMGACKRAAEMYVQALSARSETRFSAVRFGNVLGSNGSVVPIFKQQIAAGGPVTITHPDMQRYFMTIPEASQLVLEAAAIGEGGEIFILDMGEPVRIVDLAKDLIALSGLKVGEDVEIKFTGMRPGEKLFEELSVEDEGADKTRHPKIFVGKLRARDYDAVLEQIGDLARAADTNDAARVRAALAAMIPEYRTPRTATATATPLPRESVPMRESHPTP